MDEEDILQFEDYTRELNEKVVNLESLNEDRRDLGLPVIRAKRDRLNWRERPYSKIRVQEYKNVTREIPFL
jgi:hypothetical protein